MRARGAGTALLCRTRSSALPATQTAETLPSRLRPGRWRSGPRARRLRRCRRTCSPSPASRRSPDERPSCCSSVPHSLSLATRARASHQGGLARSAEANGMAAASASRARRADSGFGITGSSTRGPPPLVGQLRRVHADEFDECTRRRTRHKHKTARMPDGAPRNLSVPTHVPWTSAVLSAAVDLAVKWETGLDDGWLVGVCVRGDG